MKIIIPKRYVPHDTIWPFPLIFLAGPIRGGGDWQHEACKLIENIIPGAYVACPCRWDTWETEHPLSPLFLQGDESIFNRQLEWEQHYMAHAGLRSHGLPGCILFWLPCESKTTPHPGPEPYAMDTRGEIGEWRMRRKFENARVVVGGEDEFYGISQIERNFKHVLGPEFPLYHTLRETVFAATRVAMR